METTQRVSELGIELTIKIDLENPSLYEVGYFMVDLYQMITVFEEMNQGNLKVIDDYISETKRNYIDRRSQILKSNRNAAIIQSIEKGSLIIIITGMSLLTAVVVPILVARYNENRRRESDALLLDIQANDEYVNYMIEEASKGAFGKDGWRWMFNQLRKKGYQVSFQTDHLVYIKKFSEIMENRIFKSLQKYTPRK